MCTLLTDFRHPAHSLNTLATAVTCFFEAGDAFRTGICPRVKFSVTVNMSLMIFQLLLVLHQTLALSIQWFMTPLQVLLFGYHLEGFLISSKRWKSYGQPSHPPRDQGGIHLTLWSWRTPSGCYTRIICLKTNCFMSLLDPSCRLCLSNGLEIRSRVLCTVDCMIFGYIWIDFLLLHRTFEVIKNL